MSTKQVVNFDFSRLTFLSILEGLLEGFSDVILKLLCDNETFYGRIE